MSRVLFLGRADSPILAHLREVEGPDAVAFRDERTPVAPEDLAAEEARWAVVHGYLPLIRRPVLDALPGRVVNCHVSLLPYNRGRDPNLWSWLEDTPKGVTLHVVDAGLDTGPILAQRELHMGDDETLATSYALLQQAMLEVFAEAWPALRAGTLRPRPQAGPATLHRLADRAAVEHLLVDGWDTRVGDLRGRVRR